VAEELLQYNIRVSIVSPGSINTDFNDHSGQGAASGKDTKKKLQPDDIASVVAMLVTQAPQCFISEVLVRPPQKLEHNGTGGSESRTANSKPVRYRTAWAWADGGAAGERW
jgi:hypothetical protein